MGRRPCCSRDEGLNKGAWTSLEDKILTDYVNVHGEGKWRNLPKKAGLKRCGKSCRLRWLNYLRPDIKRGNITDDEEELIVRLHKLLGNRWSLIAGRRPGRTDNEIKNYWNTKIGKKTTRIKGPTSNDKPSIATRSTKISIPPWPQTKPQVDTSPMGMEPSFANVQDLVLKGDDVNQSEPLISYTLDENKPLDFTMDLDEMNDCFLSDLLNNDYSQFGGYDEGVHRDKMKPSTGDHGTLLLSNSPNSEENMHGPVFQALSSLLDSEIIWL